MCLHCDATSPPAPGVTRRGVLALAAGAATAALAACVRDPAPPPAATRPAPPAPDLGDAVFPDPLGHPIAAPADAPVIIIPRASWTTTKPDLANTRVMNGVAKITVHHSGFRRIFETDSWKDTVAAIVGIREFHTTDKDRKWADIAYHFVIDHVGRVWQGRPLAYQGAHAKDHNDHNLGICLMGNFDAQFPSAAQLTALTTFIPFVRTLYPIPLANIFTHGELRKTECPGRNLQSFMTRARTTWSAV